MKEQLTPVDIVKIETFCKDEVMFEAVKKVLLAGIYYHGTPEQGLSTAKEVINGAYSLVAMSTNYPIDDAILGQNLRAQWAGINVLKNAIDELKKIKSEVKADVPSPYNEAV